MNSASRTEVAVTISKCCDSALAKTSRSVSSSSIRSTASLGVGDAVLASAAFIPAHRGLCPRHGKLIPARSRRGVLFAPVVPANFLGRSLVMKTYDLHEAARSGLLTKLPPEVFPPARLSLRNAAGNTPFHAIAKYGGLRLLPADALTAATLSLRNDSGYTPLHHAALGGHLDEIPAAFLTAELLGLTSH